MAVPVMPADQIRSRLRVYERDFGYEMRYIVLRGPSGPDETYFIYGSTADLVGRSGWSIVESV
jgi:hypothetical protein